MTLEPDPSIQSQMVLCGVKQLNNSARLYLVMTRIRMPFMQATCVKVSVYVCVCAAEGRRRTANSFRSHVRPELGPASPNIRTVLHGPVTEWLMSEWRSMWGLTKEKRPNGRIAATREPLLSNRCILSDLRRSGWAERIGHPPTSNESINPLNVLAFHWRIFLYSCTWTFS